MSRPVRLLIARGHWPKGHIFIGMGGGEARELIKRGLAEWADGESAAAPTGVARPKRKSRGEGGLLDRLTGKAQSS